MAKEPQKSPPVEVPGTEEPPVQVPGTEEPPVQVPGTEEPPVQVPGTEEPSAPKSSLGSVLGHGLCIALAIGGVALAQPPLARVCKQVHERDASYPLPPPEKLPALSLGYRSATADLIWAYVLVAQGLRLHEKRRFDHAAKYFDSIFQLEPTYREPYLLMDAVLTFGAKRANEADARATRRLFEKGLKARPTDAKLHLQAGSFMAYIAVNYIPEKEHKAWRVAGAKLLLRAAELGVGNEAIEYQGVGGAAVLNRNGERKAAINILKRVYRITDDEQARANILVQLRSLDAQAAEELAKGNEKRFTDLWRKDLAFVKRPAYLILGPPSDLYGCTGKGPKADACIRDWSSWHQRGKK